MSLHPESTDPLLVAALIDHTSLKPEATGSDIAQLCSDALQFQFATVCVNPCWVTLCRDRLAGSKTKVCTVIGFPLGANTEETKLFEARQALQSGARELDVVMNIGAFRSGLHAAVQSELLALSSSAHSAGALLKVILETCLLSSEEIATASHLAAEAGADFVKTSTGFSQSGATVDHVKIMRETVGSSVGVKASGGIRDWPTLQAMIEAGATRIGTSSGVAILRQLAGSYRSDSSVQAEY